MTRRALLKLSSSEKEAFGLTLAIEVSSMCVIFERVGKIDISLI